MENISVLSLFFKKHKLVIYHLLIWAIYFFYENGAVLLIDPKNFFLISSLLYFILNAFIFYTNFYLILGHPKNSIFFSLLLLIVLIIIYFIFNLLLTVIIEWLHLPNAYNVVSTKSFFVLRTLRFGYIICMSSIYWLIDNKIKTEGLLLRTEKKRFEEAERKNQLEKEILNSEIGYLRFQINPHFLFNTMSYIYSNVVQVSEKASRSILLLSDIMNFALSNPDENGMVDIREELSHLKALIEIHQLRFENNLKINFFENEHVNSTTKKIPSLVLITFVENAFKYGILDDVNNPLIINIEVLDKTLHFRVRNKINHHLTLVKKNGIGLENIKKRLNLTYKPEDYSLEIIKSNDYYNINLNLKLQ